MAEIARDAPAWTHAKTFIQARDGRGAYYGMFNHYLGPDNVDNQASQSEKALMAITHNGEGRRWSFEKLVTGHKKHHHVLEGLVRCGYAGIDERTKVRYLLDGVKTDELDTPKSAILSETRYRNDFDACVTFVKSFIKQKSSMEAPTRHIAQTAMHQAGLAQGLNPSQADYDSVQDRYYSKEECDKLTNKQKEALRRKRAKRNHVPGSQSSKVLPGQESKKQKTNGKSVKALPRTVSALAKQIDTLNSKLDAKDVPDAVSIDGSSSQESKESGNRDNAALTRQRK